MTPQQFYFPYFFNLDEFKQIIHPFGLAADVQFDEKGIARGLAIIKRKFLQYFSSKEIMLVLPFGATLMVREDKLWYWDTDYNTMDLYQVSLSYLTTGAEILHEHIALSLSSFRHESASGLEISELVTFVRLKELRYDLDYYDQFAIIMIDGNTSRIIPFDSFNRNGGDYGYVWPALARFDLAAFKIYGSGMRMSDFIIDLRNP